jgi:hypothetical protein
VSVLSPGANSGPVNQSNSAFNRAAAFNLNEMFQALFQSTGIHFFRF